MQEGQVTSGLVAASENGHLEVVRLFVERGADVNIVNQVIWACIGLKLHGMHFMAEHVRR